MKRSGPYNTKVLLQRISTSATTDAAGELDLTVDASWATFATRSAWFKWASGSEFWNVDQVDANGVGEMGLVYDSLTKTLTPRDRVKVGSRVLHISSVNNVDERNRTVTVNVHEPK